MVDHLATFSLPNSLVDRLAIFPQPKHMVDRLAISAELHALSDGASETLKIPWDGRLQQSKYSHGTASYSSQKKCGGSGAQTYF